MITVTYTANGAKITGLSAERRGCRRLLARVQPYHEWVRTVHPNNRQKHWRRLTVEAMRKAAE